MAREEYKIRRVVKNGNTEACSLAVPIKIARVLPVDAKFTPELTTDGILYRPVKEQQESEEVPDWVAEISGGEE